MKTKTKILIVEIVIIIGIISIITGSILSDFSVIKIPDFIIMKVHNQEELMFNLFTTQATVATISIAIIALISGVVSESIYGIPLTQFISQTKPRFLKHKRLIIFSLIITPFNYFAVSYNLINLSIAFFIISIVISIILVKDTFLIFLGRKELKKQIKTYIVENYKKIGLDNFKTSLLDNDEVSRYTVLKDVLSIMKIIFEREIICCKEGKNETIERIEDILSDLFIEVVKRKISDSVVILLDYIYDLYTFANEQKEIIPLTIWDNVSEEFFISLEFISKEQLYNSNFFSDLHKQLYTNQKYKYIENEIKFTNGFDLKYFNTKSYYALIKNNSCKSDQYDKKGPTKFLFDNLFSLFHSPLKDDEVKKNEILLDYCLFVKALIDKNDQKGFSAVLFEDFYLYRELNDYKLVFVIACIYLYYLSCREESLEGSEIKENALQILEYNRKIIEETLAHINFKDFVPHYLSYINNTMRMWEVFPTKGAKIIVIHVVIEDFFLLSSIFKYWTEDQLKDVVFALYGRETFVVYDRFFGCKEKYCLSMIQQFNKLFFAEENEHFHKEKVEFLKSVLSQKYKNEVIELGKKSEITETVQENFINKVRKEYLKTVNENKYLFDEYNAENEEEYTTSKIHLCTWCLPSSMICDEKLDNYLVSNIRTSLIRAYLHTIKNSVSVQKVKYNCRKMQETLIGLIEIRKINGDTYIGNRDVFWAEEDKDKLSRFVEGMKKIPYADGNNNFYIIDHRLVHCGFSDFEVKLEDLSQQEIDSMCKINEKGEIEFNVANDIYIPFEQEELIEHVRRIRKKVSLCANIHYKLDSDNVGAGIEIYINDNES